MKRTSKIFLIAAELLFLCSLLLPALEVTLFGKGNVEGWRAAVIAIWALGDIAKDLNVLWVGATGLGNVVFLAAPWLLLRTPSTTTLRVFAGVVLVALTLALWIPHSELASSPKLLIGYFVWLLAYAALFGSIVLFQGQGGQFRKKMRTYA